MRTSAASRRPTTRIRSPTPRVRSSRRPRRARRVRACARRARLPLAEHAAAPRARYAELARARSDGSHRKRRICARSRARRARKCVAHAREQTVDIGTPSSRRDIRRPRVTGRSGRGDMTPRSTTRRRAHCGTRDRVACSASRSTTSRRRRGRNAKCCSTCCAVGAPPATLLVVPDYHRRGSVERDLAFIRAIDRPHRDAAMRSRCTAITMSTTARPRIRRSNGCSAAFSRQAKANSRR